MKTELGLHHLALCGYKPNLIVAAPPVPLDFYHSKVRIAPRGITSALPRDMATYFGIRYVEAPHNSTLAADALFANDIDVAVILGARIIKQPLIDSVNTGILNLHPGLLPDNRGLDNLKWAVLLSIPMAVTSHLIDSRIDMGRLIEILHVQVFKDDTLMDVFLRTQAVERTAMVSALDRISNGCDFPSLSSGTYRKAVPPEVEAMLDKSFEEYKAKYSAE